MLAETNELGKVARSVRGVARLARRLPGGNVVDAGAAAIDVALNATTKDERAEGYGGAAGSLAGTLAEQLQGLPSVQWYPSSGRLLAALLVLCWAAWVASRWVVGSASAGLVMSSSKGRAGRLPRIRCCGA